jgi:biopolymer transport protein ExbB
MDISSRFLAFALLGAGWVLWLLIGLSAASLAVMIERLWYFNTHSPQVGELLQAMRDLLKSRDTKSMNGTTISEALAAAVEGAKGKERARWERHLAFLATLGSNAPFIGLFGTVLGIIKAFHDLAHNQVGGPSVVMAGISDALVSTAVGLMVAIPAVVAFNYFNRRVRAKMTQVDWMAHLALAQLRGEGGAANPASAGREQ